LKYFHVDVFASAPLGGNGLCVLLPEKPLESGLMLKIAREFNQFESVFIFPQNGGGVYPARIFTTEEELPFAGHPVLGGAAVLHRVFGKGREQTEIAIGLAGRILRIESVREKDIYAETMNQGAPLFLGAADRSRIADLAQALGLGKENIDENLPAEVVSTGLPYLLVPVREGIGRARIAGEGFTDFLAEFGARFVYVFDPQTLECRTWDNTGRVEDVATGSAAGSLCAYLVRHGLKKEGEIIRISQGRYDGRPCQIEGRVMNGETSIRGKVTHFASGTVHM